MKETPAHGDLDWETGYQQKEPYARAYPKDGEQALVEVYAVGTWGDNDRQYQAFLDIVRWPQQRDFSCALAIVVPYRESLPACPRCTRGKVSNGQRLKTCDWCGGRGRSVMDEAMRLAEIYSRHIGENGVHE